MQQLVAWTEWRSLIILPQVLPPPTPTPLGSVLRGASSGRLTLFAHAYSWSSFLDISHVMGRPDPAPHRLTVYNTITAPPVASRAPFNGLTRPPSWLIWNSFIRQLNLTIIRHTSGSDSPFHPSRQQRCYFGFGVWYSSYVELAFLYYG